MATSQYAGVAFKSLDVTVNDSGLVTQSRDTSGLQTVYSYDPSGRLTSVAPPGVAATSYTYMNAAASGGVLTAPRKWSRPRPLRVPGVPGVPVRFLRPSLAREAAHARRQLEHDRDARRRARSPCLSVSTPQSLAGVSADLSLIPTYKTTFAYDALGRTTRVTPPDSATGSDPKSVRTAYTGTRQVTRTVTTATSSGSADVSVVERTTARAA